MKLVTIALGFAAWLATPGTNVAQAEDVEGFFIAERDFFLIDQWLIAPVIEYVEIAERSDGAMAFEVGFLHLVAEPRLMLARLVQEADALDMDIADAGQIDLGRLRRIVTSGVATVDEGSLRWHPRSFTPTRHDLRTLGEVEGLLPPFQTATAEAYGTGDPASLGFAMQEDALVVEDRDGAFYHYRRADPAALRASGMFALWGLISFVEHRQCLMAIGEALVTGDGYRFSETALSQVANAYITDDTTQMIWDGLIERGPDHLLARFVERSAAAFPYAAEILETEIADFGGLAAYAASDSSLLRNLNYLEIQLQFVTRLHHFSDDYMTSAGWIDGEYSEVYFDYVRQYTEQFRHDPWSVTAPFVQGLNNGWLDPVLLLVEAECQHLHAQ